MNPIIAKPIQIISGSDISKVRKNELIRTAFLIMAYHTVEKTMYYIPRYFDERKIGDKYPVIIKANSDIEAVYKFKIYIESDKKERAFYDDWLDDSIEEIISEGVETIEDLVKELVDMQMTNDTLWLDKINMSII